MFYIGCDEPGAGVRDEYTHALLASGYSQEQAAMIFDIAWQACAEAQAKLAEVCNRVPEGLQIPTGALAATMLNRACVSLVLHCEEESERRMVNHMLRRIFGKGI